MTIPTTRTDRAAWFAGKGGLDAALDGHALSQQAQHQRLGQG